MKNETRRKILVIEDDEDIALSLAELLEDVGYEVEKASNGLVAIKSLEKSLENSDNLPSLIILDLMMPVMDGRSFRNEQVKNSKLREIPVVVMSADGNVERKIAETGAAGYLKKPVNIDDIIKTLETFVL